MKYWKIKGQSYQIKWSVEKYHTIAIYVCNLPYNRKQQQ